jgi:chemotaxis protein histidine kinase CheA
MTETTAQTEPRRPKQLEILDTTSYGGLYVRLYIASQSPKEQMANIINPDARIDATKPPEQSTQNFNDITEGLSRKEREEPWKDTAFEDAHSQWCAKLTQAVNTTTDEKRIAAIEAISGKKASEFTKEDAAKLYDTFCKGKSDVTAFAELIISSNLQKNGKVDAAKIKALSSGFKWIAGGLFGEQTGITTLRIIELKTELTNNPTKSVKKLFANADRVNQLTEDEKHILTSLYEGFKPTAAEAKKDEEEEAAVAAESEDESEPVENEEPAPAASASEPEPPKSPAHYYLMSRK